MSDISSHSKWVAEQVAAARESGIRDTMELTTVAHVVAHLYQLIEELELENAQHKTNQLLILGTAPIDPFKLGEFLKTLPPKES
jgi:hypothetical protein